MTVLATTRSMTSLNATFTEAIPPQTAMEHKYEKVRCIGQGSFGAAYLVRCVESRCLYVMKEVPVGGLGEKERAEARHEVDVLSLLRHPNIVTYRESYEAQSRDGIPGVGNGSQKVLRIIMDFCDGGDLYKRIAAQRAKGLPFPEETILDWFAQICLAVKHVHDRKILHRDIKSQNVFLTRDGKVKLGDFGIAKILSGTSDLAKTAIGTPFYLSPEMVEGRAYDRKSDMWALGCVLYEMTTLRHAFQAGDMCNVVLKILRGVYPPVPRQYSADLRSLVGSLLRRNPRERPTVDEVLSSPLVSRRVSKCLDGVLVVQRALETKRNERLKVTSPAAKYGVPLRGKRTPPVTPVRARGKVLTRPVQQADRPVEEFLWRKKQAAANRERVRGKPIPLKQDPEVIRMRIEAHRDKVEAELKALQRKIQRGRWESVESKIPPLNLHDLPLEETSTVMEATNADDRVIIFQEQEEVTENRVNSDTVVLSKLDRTLVNDPPEPLTEEPFQDPSNSGEITLVAKSMVAQTIVIATAECAMEDAQGTPREDTSKFKPEQESSLFFPPISPEPSTLKSGSACSGSPVEQLTLPPTSPLPAKPVPQSTFGQVQLPVLRGSVKKRPSTSTKPVQRRDSTVPEKLPSTSEPMLRSLSLPELTSVAISRGPDHCSCCRHHGTSGIKKKKSKVTSSHDSDQTEYDADAEEDGDDDDGGDEDLESLRDDMARILNQPSFSSGAEDEEFAANNIYEQLEEWRMELETTLGLDTFVKVYREVQHFHEEEDATLSEVAEKAKGILGEARDHLWTKVLHLVIAEGVFAD